MKKLLTIIMICALSLILAGCKKESENTQLRIAYFANITHAQAMVMKSQGRLEEKLGEGCEVSWTAFNAGPAVTEAMFAGEIDLAYIGPVPAINAYVKSDGDIRIIAGATNGGAVLVSRKDLIMQTISELSGKTVAVPQFGNTQHLLLLNILSENGLETTSNGGTVNVIAVANADVEALMDRGEVDAALVPEPWGSVLEGKVNANLVLDATALWKDGNYSTAVVIVSKDFLDNHKDIVEEFMIVHKDATIYINENYEEAKSIVNEQIEIVTSKTIPQEVLDKAFSSLVVSELIPSESINEYAEISMKAGFIEKMPDEKLIDSSVLEGTK